MPKLVTTKVEVRRIRKSVSAVILGAAVMLIASGIASASASSGTQSAVAKQKLIIFGLSFPCGLNFYATNLCNGVRAAAKNLPPGYKVQIKTGINYSDNVAFNNLIQTSLQLKPAGLIIFPAGPAAQTPMLNRACAQNVKVIIIDSAANGVKCQSSFIGSNHYQQGVLDGKWLIAHPSSTKEVGIVSLPPGEYASNDARVRGFTKTVTAAGYRVVATVVTTNALDETRSLVTNMITAHPNLGAIFSANGILGQGVAQALKGNNNVIHLTLDGFPDNIKLILKGELGADTAQNSYRMGKLSVENMFRVLKAQKIPRRIAISGTLVDKTNAKQYLAAGGLR